MTRVQQQKEHDLRQRYPDLYKPKPVRTIKVLLQNPFTKFK